MSQSSLGKQILEQWIAHLRTNKDKSYKSVRSNFDELFGDFKSAGVSEKEAKEYNELAIKAHFPKIALARHLYYSKPGIKGLHDSPDAFYKEWCDSIRSEAMASFFDYYPIIVEKKEKTNVGGMSRKEYNLQRAYAESFPVLDTTHLEALLRERRNSETVDFTDILGGNNDEENN
jgi:hypothetical protein